jgi:hypothetical protein
MPMMRVVTWVTMVAVLGLNGCLYAGAAVGAKFATGNESGPVEATPAETAEAARAVLIDGGFRIVEDKVERSGEIEIEGENAEGRKARLKIKPMADATKLSVRVGLLGDNDESSLYFDRIKQRAE